MAKKYNLYPIKTIKDWQGEDWDVYEERKISIGIVLNYGWLYGMPRKGIKALILTSELAQIFKDYSWREMIDVFGIPSTTASKIRRTLHLQKTLPKRNYDWIIQHQNEILYSSYLMLQEKYGLSKGVVKSYSNFLVHDLGIKRNGTRNYASQFLVEKIYQTYKEKISQCKSFKELQHILNTDAYTARKFHEMACVELNVPAMSELHLKQLDETWQWRYQYKDIILNSKMAIVEIAAQLNVSKDEIYNARKALRRRLDIKETIGVVRGLNMENWVLEHEAELTTLTISQLQQTFHISKGQVKYRRMLLKKLEQSKTKPSL